MLLVMRVLSILPLNFKVTFAPEHPLSLTCTADWGDLLMQPIRWEGPLSRELLTFNSFVRSLSRALRTLIECTALNMLLQHHCRRERDDLLDISLSLPFQADVNTGYGILIKVYLDGLVHLYGGPVVDPEAEGVREAKDDALDFCDETFSGVKDPRNEVKRGFRFWDAVRDFDSSFAVFVPPTLESAERFGDDSG